MLWCMHCVLCPGACAAKCMCQHGRCTLRSLIFMLTAFGERSLIRILATQSLPG